TEPQTVYPFPPGASKWDIRQKVWDYIEEKNLANFPRPVHNRIPNFKAQKTLLVPTPRLRTGLFNKITPPQGASKEQLRVCSSSQVDLVVVGSVAVSEKGDCSTSAYHFI
uniref:Methenyltetrahydrofolate synthetase domain containing n=1 Tax=Lates calcarifer TaxID=8187 RepID=A0A4W6C2R8_LATCA